MRGSVAGMGAEHESRFGPRVGGVEIAKPGDEFAVSGPGACVEAGAVGSAPDVAGGDLEVEGAVGLRCPGGGGGLPVVGTEGGGWRGKRSGRGGFTGVERTMPTGKGRAGGGVAARGEADMDGGGEAGEGGGAEVCPGLAVGGDVGGDGVAVAFEAEMVPVVGGGGDLSAGAAGIGTSLKDNAVGSGAADKEDMAGVFIQ